MANEFYKAEIARLMQEQIDDEKRWRAARIEARRVAWIEGRLKNPSLVTPVELLARPTKNSCEYATTQLGDTTSRARDDSMGVRA